MNRWWLAAVAPALVVLAMGPPGRAADENSPAKKPGGGVPDAAKNKEAGKKIAVIKPATCALKEVPAFGKIEIGGSTRITYPQGAYVAASPVPSKEVKAYPKLKSKHPMYGMISFDGESSKTFYFVLDESGEKKADAAKTEKSTKKKSTKKAAEKDTKTQTATSNLVITANAYAVPAATKTADKDCQQTTTASAVTVTAAAVVEDDEVVAYTRPANTSKYDLLYFDRNGDLDLTNDGVIKLSDKSPFEGMPGPAGGYFQDLKVKFDFGAGVGKREITLVPHAMGYGTDMVLMQFLPKTARQGKIKLGGQEYIARLSQSRVISGRYDRPNVQLELYPADASRQGRAFSGTLGSMQCIDGRYITFSATPLGDKLTIEPYRGETGALEVVAGGRTITELGISGQLVSSKGMVLPMGDTMLSESDALPRRYELPVGDYSLTYFMVQHGRLRFSGRMVATLARGTPEGTKPPAFPIHIQKGKPCKLEFSGKPEVRFEQPVKDKTFKAGQSVYIAAMLTEPWQGIQITGLWDTTAKEGSRASTQLNPNIVIRNAKGDVVAEGVMPFG